MCAKNNATALFPVRFCQTYPLSLDCVSIMSVCVLLRSYVLISDITIIIIIIVIIITITISSIPARTSFALLQSALVCLRGSREKRCTAPFKFSVL